MKMINQESAESIPVSLLPLREIAGFPVRPGLYDMNGATLLQDGVNFTVHTHYGTGCELLLFKREGREPYAVLPFPEEYKIGNVYSMIVFGLDIGEFEYAYRVDGPHDPGAGLLFDREQILLDPYAKAVTGQSVWGEKQEPGCTYRARVVKNNFDWGDMPQSGREMSDLVIYELHVRGFTRHSSSGVVHPGTFEGILEKIPYLKRLGVNAVELMPVFEFDETMGGREVNGQKLLDYWGYNTVGFFAPNTSYTAGLEYNREGTEFKNLIRTLHENGIEVILDVVFNHTAEGNEKGPVISFKGFDNNIYYMLTPDGYYYNFSGCGNTLNCNHPIVQQMIVECLRYWTVDYRVDGFRFDLASILGRNEDGSPMNNPPLLQRLAFDPILGNVKLIAEAWDAGGLYQVGTFPAWKRWAEWNGKYRDTLREFLKGGTWAAREAARRITGSGGPLQRPLCGLQFLGEFHHLPRRFYSLRPVRLQRKAQSGERLGEYRRHGRQPQLELRRGGADGRQRGAGSAFPHDAQRLRGADVQPRHAHVFCRGRVRQHAVWQQQRLLPGQRDFLAQLGSAQGK